LKVLLLILLLFLGCAEKKFININENVKPIYNTKQVIGIEEISLPLYMNDLEIMKLKNNQFINTKIYLSKDINSLIINLLSNQLNDPFIFKYPFEFDKKPHLIIKINITDFYLKNNNIYLFSKIYIKKKNHIKFTEINLNKKCIKNFECISKIFEDFSKTLSKELKDEI